MSIKAIETSYSGYKFRSRLEARWAVFFDSLGLKWEYEPEGFHLPDGQMYLPDFHLGTYEPGQHTYGPWVEIKGTEPSESEINKLVSLCESLTSYGVLLWGTPGDEKWIWVHKEGFVGDTHDLTGNHWWEYVVGKDVRQIHNSDAQSAATAARSARFEHGQKGAR